MRLSRLDLEFFGHFTGKALDFGPATKGKADFHVLYGPNEAGKTTLMEGYLRLLYGFAPRNEPYAFRHDRNVLRVSGTLDIGDAETRFTRVPGRTGTLLDAGGTALPETALSGALAGLGQDDYRKLLCLDDATIEAGGEEIAASQGDIGRLLFAAAAGIGELSAVLDAAQAEARGLYLKGGSTSDFAALKRRLEEVEAAIADGDVTAARYGKLRADLAAAEAAVAQASTAHRDLAEQAARLTALAGALPLLPEIAAAEAELAPLSAHREMLDIDPDALADLLTRKTGLDTDRRGLAERIDELTRERAETTADAALAGLAQKVADLKPQRDRCAPAASDLPRRRAELREVTAGMQSALREIGIDGGGAPERFVPDRPVLADLQRRIEAAALADTASRKAEEEAQAAQEACETAASLLQGVTGALDDCPDLHPILDTHGADRVLERARAATQSLRERKRAADAALEILTLGARRFSAVPDLPLTAAAARQLDGALRDAKAEARRRAEAVAETAATADRLARQLAAQENAAGLIADTAAAAARSRRDALWADHRDALSDETAGTFEAAMQADDIVTAARLARAADLGELRSLQARLDEARAEHTARLTASDTAQAALAETRADLARHLATAGWPEDADPDTFADWLARAETARDALAVLAAERAAAAGDLAAADGLRAALAEKLGAGEAPLDALMDQSRERIRERADLEASLRSARDADAEARRVADRRQTQADMARDAAARARAARDSALTEALGTAPRVSAADTLAVLRDLREFDQRREALQHQIDGMSRDARAFAGALGDLCDVPANMTPVAAYDALAADVTAAVEAVRRRDAIAAALSDLEEKDRGLARDLAGIDAALADLASAFDPSIPTGTPGDLRRAVTNGHRALSLRAEIGRLTRDLCARLGTATRAEAAAMLLDRTPEAVAADLDEAQTALTAAAATRDMAIAARATAAAALAAVTGSADIAALAAEKKTLELEQEALMMRYVRLELGHRLATAALRRYRDGHRSGMMRAADAAFRDLTNGAYSGLTTLASGSDEVLVAIHAADGAAKQVDTLSKGTRFQLYLALRAAAYDQMADGGTVLPFFCDDVFETFDEDRTRAACRLMRRIGLRGQAIYLTHHRHVVEIAEEVCGGEVTIHRL